MRKAVLDFVKGLRIEFCDRGLALKQFKAIADRGTRLPIVLFGPKGCGKTALLKQLAIVFEEYGYSVLYINPSESEIEKALYVSNSIKKIVIETLKELVSRYLGDFVKAIAYLGFSAINRVLKRFRRSSIALLIDDVFQVIGVEKQVVSTYVKSALNLIEYPVAEYDRIAVIITTSEGLSRYEIGRHSWSIIYGIWNMSRDGFEELYNKIPGTKPSFDDVWRFVGGNPRYLGILYEYSWDIDRVVDLVIRSRGLKKFIAELSDEEKEVLIRMVDNPDYLWYRLRDYSELANKLVKLNLIVLDLFDRSTTAWIDTPPPQRDIDLGIGEHVAWQTPIHREAMKQTLKITA